MLGYINFATIAQRKVRRAAGLPPFPLIAMERWLLLCCRVNGKPRANTAGSAMVLRWKNGTVVCFGRIPS